VFVNNSVLRSRVFLPPHRFAEIGNCQSFDSSPDGRTLVFAAGKLKFFDLGQKLLIGLSDGRMELWDLAILRK
jgi:hypothetical protein